ncbi:MBL fold metallo-hydrolase [bacterium]|nr:MAG: MBL fold metallo-hydrolase [bacterium]
MIVIASTIGIIILIAIIFLNTSPEFGGIHLEDRVRIYQESGRYKDGKFINEVKTDMNMPIGTALGVLAEFLKSDPSRAPFEVPVRKMDSKILINPDTSETRITWLGHSAFIIQAKGKTILLDPMFGDVPAPHPWLGKKRYYHEMPIQIEDLPEVDLVLYSHDHYDHLDYGSVKKLKDKVKHWVVPLGLGAHLKAWGVKQSRIYELNWWDDIELEGFMLTSTPARHFSGRGIFDRYSTLWTSWVIDSGSKKIYFSGDSGYGEHFKEIGNTLGPFDFALMECGQYDARWEQIHMLPEQTVQAAIDLKTKNFMPIHWGAFTLALHPWNEPPERAEKHSLVTHQAIVIPEIGETLVVENLGDSSRVSDWWRD